MTPVEIQWLSNHLGHEVTTHKNKYRLHAPSIELTKVGKLLMAMDNEGVPYAGKRTRTLLQETTESGA